MLDITGTYPKTSLLFLRMRQVSEGLDDVAVKKAAIKEELIVLIRLRAVQLSGSIDKCVDELYRLIWDTV